MTKTRSTKRALLVSAISLFVCVSMLIGSTYAWFTDSVTSKGNKIVAGKLDVQLWMADSQGNYSDISSSTNPIFGAGSIAQNNNAETLWEPGKTQVAYLQIKNNGNLALKYTVGLDVQNVSKDLYKVMKYTITPDAEYDSVKTWDSSKANSVVVGTQAVTNGDTVMKPGDVHSFALSIHMDEKAGNEYQGGEVNFDLTIMATQATVEEDSFDDQYDKDADYIPAVNSLAELRAALTTGGEYKLGTDITVENSDMLYAADGGHKDGSAFFVKAKTMLDLNGHDIIVNAPSAWSEVFFMKWGADLTIKGDGDLSANCSMACVYDANSTLNVKGGNFDVTANNDMLYAIYGKINVSGGTFTTSYWNTINIYGSGRTHLVDVSGGSFKGWNPAAAPDGNLLAEGYKSVEVYIEEDKYYCVVPEEVDAVATTATNFKQAIDSALKGDTVALGTDIEIPSGAAFAIDKEITLDLNGQTLTSNASYGGIQAKSGLSIKNGTFNYTQTNAAIKVWNMKSIEDVTIICTPQAGKTIGGIVVQNHAEDRIETIKNVTIIGATNGIECYRSTNANSIGSMENVKIEATQNGIWLNGAGCIGSMTNCDIYGADIGINAYLANLWHISLDIKNSKISGGRHGIDIWDESKTNTGSTVTFNYDDATTFAGGTWDMKVTLQDEINCTINDKAQTSPCEIYVKN